MAPDGSSFFALAGSGVQNLKTLIWSRDHGRTEKTVFTVSAPYAGIGGVSFDGRWLLFMADHSQDLTGAWDLYACAAAALPAPLAQARTASASVASDGTTWTWTSADYTTLYAWRTGMAAPVTVRTGEQGDTMDLVGVSGDVVTWTSQTATFAANLTTGSFTQLTKQYGSALTNGDAVAVYYPLGDVKSPDLAYAGYVLRLSDLTRLPRC